MTPEQALADLGYLARVDEPFRGADRDKALALLTALAESQRRAGAEAERRQVLHEVDREIAKFHEEHVAASASAGPSWKRKHAVWAEGVDATRQRLRFYATFDGYWPATPPGGKEGA